MIKIGDIVNNRYRIVEHIGSGGMADVFEANDIVENRFVAVKIIKEAILKDERSLKNFQDEIKISSSLKHPNIVKVFDQGVFDKRPFIVLEYFKEQTLMDRLEFYTKFAVKEAVDILIQINDAVSYTHKHGLIHRDIKPQNIFYLSNGTIKLGDFGIATSKEDGDARIVGSAYYLAPEVCEGKSFSQQSDVYALGITLFQLVTGTLPFDSARVEVVMNHHMKKAMPIPSKINPLIPKELDDIILRATAKNLGDRFYSADEFMKALIAFKNGKYKKQSAIAKLLKHI